MNHGFLTQLYIYMSARKYTQFQISYTSVFCLYYTLIMILSTEPDLQIFFSYYIILIISKLTTSNILSPSNNIQSSTFNIMRC